jgi:DNA-binding SARP family transcriptional activator
VPARQQHLLAYLALHRDQAVPRPQIAGQLWPDTRDAQALTNLRRELHHLRQTAPAISAALDGRGRSVTWHLRLRPIFDVVEFEEAIDRGLMGDRQALEHACGLYRGDLLPSCDDEWIRGERDRLRRRFVEGLGRLVAHLEAERAFGAAIDKARRLLAIDPLDEAAWRSLIRCHASRGERASALHEYHRCAAMLRRELGVPPSAETRKTYREIIEHDQAQTEVPVAALQPSTYPLVGRASEWATLLNSWRAATGSARLTVVRGEAGIGKTRLAEELIDWCAAQSVRAAVTRCYAGGGRLAFAPIAAWLQDRSLQPALDTLDAVWLGEIARLHPGLLSRRQGIPPLAAALDSWQRTRFFDAIVHAFETASPLVLVVDDLQWCDADTLDWLQFFLRSTRQVRCLLVGTVRSEEARDNDALGALLRDAERAGRLTTIDLGSLDEAATGRLAEAVTERALDPEVREQLFRRSEGHPLFIIESARAGPHALAPGGVSSSRIHAVIESRLLQLSPQARSIAELAAAIGRDFSFPVLAHVSDFEEDAVVRALDELWQRQIVRAHGDDHWDFSHDQIREVAYGRVGPAHRRLLHRRIAQAVEQVAGADLDGVSASLAMHLEKAGQFGRALEFYERAARVALGMTAHEEAIRCGSHALMLLERMPPGPERDRRELQMRTPLAGSFTASRGYAAPATETNVERIAELEASLGCVSVPSLWSHWTLRFMLADLDHARQLAESALALAEAQGDPSYLCDAHHAIGGTLTSLGEFAAARRHFEAALASWGGVRPWPSAHGSDLGVFTHAWFAHVLALTVENDGASAHARHAIELASRLEHAYSRALALAYGAMTAQIQRDEATVRERAEVCIALCERHGFAYYGDWARILLGWHFARHGRAAEGIPMIEGALRRLDAQRAFTRRPYYLSLLAESHVANQDPGGALAAVEQALRLADAHRDHWWTPQLRTLSRTIHERSAS